MVDYTGQALTWEQAINSQQKLAPAKYAFDADPPILPDKDGRYPIAVPGETKFCVAMGTPHAPAPAGPLASRAKAAPR